MAGTLQGSKAAAETNKAKYGDDFYRHIGAKGGAAYDRQFSPPKGFAARRDIARLAGARGGRISRRTKGIIKEA